jgi:hypothetical protein
VSIVGRVSFVLLIASGAIGCTSDFFNRGQQPSTQREFPTGQTGPVGTSMSDRLRDDGVRGSSAGPVSEPTRSLEPGRPQERAQPQGPTGPPEVGPVQSTVEPDPRAVIDWLLKERR